MRKVPYAINEARFFELVLDSVKKFFPMFFPQEIDLYQIDIMVTSFEKCNEKKMAKKVRSFSVEWLTYRVISDKVHDLFFFGRIDSCNFLVYYQS